MQNNLSHNNNFDFLRFLLASLVIFTHCFALTGDIRQDPIFPYTNRVLSEIAVCGFFVISGFLIQTSLNRSSSVKTFLTKRVLRILPGLLVAVLFTVFCIGAWASSMSIVQYLSHATTWRYLFSNILLLPVQPTLPGVFEHHVETAVNGSLWTLRYEIFYYLATAALFFVSMRVRQLGIALVGLLCIVGFCLGRYGLISNEGSLAKFLFYLFNLGAYFMAGSLLSFYTTQLHRRKSLYALISGIVFIGSLLMYSKALLPVNMLAFAVFIITLGLHYTPVLHFSKYTGDISYGTYIYAYPIQQLLIVLLQPLNAWQLLLPSLLLSWLAGWLSWHAVEKQFIKRKIG